MNESAVAEAHLMEWFIQRQYYVIPIVFCTYAPDNEWFIETMNTVFSLGGDMMHPDLPNSFLKLLSEGEVLPHSHAFDTD